MGYPIACKKHAKLDDHCAHCRAWEVGWNYYFDRFCQTNPIVQTFRANNTTVTMKGIKR